MRRFIAGDGAPVLWSVGKSDLLALMLIGFLPLLVALPLLVGWLHADPMLYVARVTADHAGGVLPGIPYLDPSSGIYSQALGYRVASEWIHGQVPWWNPFSGIGLPLAAEYQPGAFFPFTLLLLLPQGFLLQHLLLQMLAGWGTYGLLRQLGLQRTAALAGALLFAFNGTLAWFGHAPAFPAAFLPWMLWGVERAYSKVELGLRGGWRLVALALALNLLAGFPETAYINGLLVAAWSLLRWIQTSPGKRLEFAGRIALGGAIGIALSAPQILAFVEFLPHSFVAGHTGAFAHSALAPWALLSSVVEPYAYWPLLGQPAPELPLYEMLGNIGGYVTLAVLIVALYEVVARPAIFSYFLLGWSALALAKSFGLEPVVSAWNLIPGIPETAFHRYAPPTWELAIIILAARGLDRSFSEQPTRPSLFAALFVFLSALAASALFLGKYLLPYFAHSPVIRIYASASALWTMLAGLACVTLLLAHPARWRQISLAVLLVADGALTYALPTLSNPRDGKVDMAAIGFLREHLGLQRFYTLGPIHPNYSAYFGIGSVNYMYIPLPNRWRDWVHLHLDRYLVYPTQFTGSSTRPENAPSAASELLRNLKAYEETGVKYVVAPSSAENLFSETISSRTSPTGGQPIGLHPGQSVDGTLPASLIEEDTTVTSVGVLLGNYNGSSNGLLQVTLCSRGDCVTGSRDLGESRDNTMFDIVLDKPLNLATGAPVHYQFAATGSTRAVALWAFPTMGESARQNIEAPAGLRDHLGLRIRLRIKAAPEPRPRRVYSDELMSIYELPDPKPYFEAKDGHCSLSVSSRDRVRADCDAPATLIRRELFFPGWAAEVNGEISEITEYGELFQAIPLPKGASEVRFDYAPPRIAWAWLVMWLAVAALVADLFRKTGASRNIPEVRALAT